MVSAWFPGLNSLRLGRRDHVGEGRCPVKLWVVGKEHSGN